MKFWRIGNSYRGAIQCGAGRDAFIGLVPATSPTGGAPRLVAVPRLKADAPNTMEPSDVVAAVTRALRDVASATGVTITVESIEYVPDDSPQYDLQYVVAREIAARLAKNVEFPTSR